ncbi:hypothetical protein [Trinickia soli]
MLGVKARRILVQDMKTKWGSCNPVTGNIRREYGLGAQAARMLGIHPRA